MSGIDSGAALPMNLQIEVRGLEEEARGRFTNAAQAAAVVFAGLAPVYGVELPELLIIGTLDFQETVHELLQKLHGPDEPRS
jgi:hypothetical protein